MSDLTPPPAAPTATEPPADRAAAIAAEDEQRFRIRRGFERAFVAHLVAYPLAFVAACAAMPGTMVLFEADLDRFGDDMQAIGQYIVRLTAWPAGALFVIAHGIALPWVFGRDPARGRRFFWKTFGALSVLVLLAGGASWAWLWLR